MLFRDEVCFLLTLTVDKFKMLIDKNVEFYRKSRMSIA